MPEFSKIECWFQQILVGSVRGKSLAGVGKEPTKDCYLLKLDVLREIESFSCAEELPHFVECVTCKHKDQNSIPRT